MRWRCFGHGSGKNTRIAASDPRRNTGHEVDDVAFDDSDVAQPASFDRVSTVAMPGVCTSTPMTCSSGTQFGDLDQGLATTETDVEDHVAGTVDHVGERIDERQLRSLDRQPELGHRPFVRCDS